MDYIVCGIAEGERDKYWTGLMLSTWPEYLSSRSLALKIDLVTARRAAVHFNERFGADALIRWHAVLIRV